MLPTSMFRSNDANKCNVGILFDGRIGTTEGLCSEALEGLGSTGSIVLTISTIRTDTWDITARIPRTGNSGREEFSINKHRWETHFRYFRSPFSASQIRKRLKVKKKGPHANHPAAHSQRPGDSRVQEQVGRTDRLPSAPRRVH